MPQNTYNITPPGKYMFLEYSWNIPRGYSQYIWKIFPIKFRGRFRKNVPGILNIGIFPDYSMNIIRMFLSSFLGGSRNTTIVFFCSFLCFTFKYSILRNKLHYNIKSNNYFESIKSNKVPRYHVTTDFGCPTQATKK